MTIFSFLCAFFGGEEIYVAPNFIAVVYVILIMFSLISHQRSFTSKTFSGYQCYREIKNPDSKYSTAALGERDGRLTCSAVPFVL